MSYLHLSITKTKVLSTLMEDSRPPRFSRFGRRSGGFTDASGTSHKQLMIGHWHRCNIHKTNGLNHPRFWNCLIWMYFPCPYHLSLCQRRLLHSVSCLPARMQHESLHLIDHFPKLERGSQSSSWLHCSHRIELFIWGFSRNRDHRIFSSYQKYQIVRSRI